MIPKHKEREHEALNRQVEEFLNSGGRIEKLDSGLLSTDYAATQHSKAVLANAKKVKKTAKDRIKRQFAEFDKVDQLLRVYGTAPKLAKALSMPSTQVRRYLARENYIGEKPLGRITALHTELRRLGKL